MADITYNKFLEYVLPHVPGVPESIALRSIRDAVIDFCDESRSWVVTLDPVYIFAGTTEMHIDLPANSALAGVNMLTADDLSNPLPMKDYVVEGGFIKLLAPCSRDIYIRATVALKPLRSATVCPDFLYEDWAEPIGAGAQAMLFSMSNMEWGNMKAAQLNYGIYRNGVVKARRYAKVGRIAGNTRVIEIDLQ